MKINLTNLTQKLEKQDYLEDLETVKYADISKSKTKIKQIASKMISETLAAIKHDSLSHIALEVSGQRPITFALETNIINLPYSNYKKIANFFDEGEDYPIFVYFETQSEFLNASGFRIDQLATQEEVEQNTDDVVDNLTDAIQLKIKQVREYKKPAAPAKKKTTTKKTATRAKRNKSTK